MNRNFDPDATSDYHIARALQKADIDNPSIERNYRKLAVAPGGKVLHKRVPSHTASPIRFRTWCGRDKGHARKYQSYVVPINTINFKLNEVSKTFINRKPCYLQKQGRTKREKKSAAENKRKNSKKTIKVFDAPAANIPNIILTDIVSNLMPMQSETINERKVEEKKFIRVLFPLINNKKQLNPETRIPKLSFSSHSTCVNPQNQPKFSDILSDTSFLKENKKEKYFLCQAYQAVARYCCSPLEGKSPRIVSIHLPKPEENLESSYKSFPKLAMR